MKTIAQTKIEEMTNNGYKFAGQTRGWLSFRKGSNLARKLASLGLDKGSVEVMTGARAGRYRNDGYQLLIFTK